MPLIKEIREDICVYTRTHGLTAKWNKAKALFEHNPSHPSLHTELLEPRHRLIYILQAGQKAPGTVHLSL